MELYIAMTCVGFLAGGLQGLTGFGTVMVALPLFTMLVDIKTAVPLIALLGLFINAVQTAQLRRDVAWKLLLPILLGSLLAIPIGGQLLRIVPSFWLQAFFGCILICFVLFTMYVRPRKRPLHAAWAWIAGLVSGLLGGSIGANGPPVIVYATLGPWNKEQTKAMLVAYLFGNFILICAYYTITAVFTGQIAGYFAATMPGTLLGIGAGTLLSRRIGEGGYHKLVLLILLILGVTMIYKSITA